MTPEKDQNLWRANLDGLFQTQPGLARILETIQPENIEVHRSRSGHPVPAKKGVTFHSLVDPWAEAVTMVEAQARTWPQPPESILALGFGFGYHLEVLARFGVPLLVLEPDLGLVRAAMERLDLTGLWPRLRLLEPQEPAPPDVRRRAALFIHRPTARLYPVALARIQAEGHPAPTSPDHWKILVATPVAGGSLPVAGHAARALEALGHSVIQADFSPLAAFQPHPADAHPALGDRIIGLAEEYLDHLVHQHQPDLLLALAQAPLTPKGLARIRSRGLRTAFWFVEDYRRFPYYKEVAGAYDCFFHIQGEDLDRELARWGARRTFHLPMAADEVRFQPPMVDEPDPDYRSFLSFMGEGYSNRRDLLAGLLDFDLKVWGSGWDLDSPLGARVQWGGRRVSTEETVRIFSGADINLNLHWSAFPTGTDPDGGYLNPRAFEIAALGAFQLVDRRPLCGRYFDLETEMAVFDDLADLREKIAYFRDHPDQRKDMAGRARARVLAEHTYRHRMKTLLDCAALA